MWSPIRTEPQVFLSFMHLSFHLHIVTFKSLYISCEGTADLPLFSVCWVGTPWQWASEGSEGWLGWHRWGSAEQLRYWELRERPEPLRLLHNLPSWPPEGLAWEKVSRRNLHHCPWPPAAAAPSAAERPVYWCTPHRPGRDNTQKILCLQSHW